MHKVRVIFYGLVAGWYENQAAVLTCTGLSQILSGEKCSSIPLITKPKNSRCSLIPTFIPPQRIPKLEELAKLLEVCTSVMALTRVPASGSGSLVLPAPYLHCFRGDPTVPAGWLGPRL